jgi:tetratricopeptide (TPR) repeat protein
MTARILVAAGMLLCAVNAFAQPAVPEAGLAAEMAGEWQQALDIYKGVLAREPHDAKLWVRVADIEAHLDNVEGSAAALRQAVQAAPQDAALHQRLSQAYAVLRQPLAALEAIERALVLTPDSIEFLRARGELASWLADYDRAQDSYRRLAALQPDDREVLLNLARVNAWGGRTDAAVDAYEQSVRLEPGAAGVWIELARTEAWRGNYGAALEHLKQYRARFGEDETYSRQVAAVLARAGQPGKALDTLEPMLREHPDDYELHLTRAIALTMQRRPREAADALATIRQLQPDSYETRAAERTARTVLASTAEPAVVSVYGDSSGLDVQRFDPRATVQLSSGTTFAGGYEHQVLTALPGSGLEPIHGSPEARYSQLWASAAQQFGVVNLRGRVGQARTATGDLTTYTIGAQVRPFDGLTLSVERDSGFYVVSPRTIALGLRQVGHRARLDWSPNVRAHVAADVLYQDLSDGNRRWEFTLAPRGSVARRAGLNLDLGAVVSQISTTTNFDNGYYDPSRYDYYAGAVYPYWKVNENVGVGLSLALGAQRDDFSPSFRPGGQATGEATFGIYNDWVFKVTGGGIFNQRLGTGAFSGYGAGLSLVRRF